MSNGLPPVRSQTKDVPWQNTRNLPAKVAPDGRQKGQCVTFVSN